ncbi:hypothetical protein [Halobacterium litoreum]|uniref:Tat (Twin-arginine translocation) pathway signal sequence n=1 Tax=Halobacterium litoreum TaxID=2039234 RepID=A0ABD5NG70_9EURY|nr:hypothetical protein [Halobacterium litoreum]UHH13115.1 hypothetical protein LT972_13255 [Halobacterium litoreum]
MPSTNRRQFLAAAGAAGAAGLAGCGALGGGGRPDVNTGSGLDEDTSHALQSEQVYLAGDASDLPDPPNTVDSIDDADAVLATTDADRVPLVRALRDHKPVAFDGGDAQSALRGLLESTRQNYTFGVEEVRARPVPVAVAVPGRNGTVDTYTFVDDGGWDDPVLDAFGWALVGRVPECDTFVPESSADSMYDYAGSAHVVGRLDTGEAYVSRTTATVSRQDAGRFVRLRTRLHAEANDGYAIEEGVREADFPDDQRLHRAWPNPHTENGVQIANTSNTIRSDFSFEVTPESSRAKSALTGCGGLRTDGEIAYDHRVSVTWKRDKLLGNDRRYATATGRGEWHLDA